MVRLQLGSEQFRLIPASESQFHNGSITTHLPLTFLMLTAEVSIPQWFDYNENQVNIIIYGMVVSIPQWFDYNGNVRKIEPYALCSLNSTMVRLQLKSGKKDFLVPIPSQFHNGSITTEQFNLK